MAKVTGALFSLKASGTLGRTITYVCGMIARRAETAKEGEQKGNEEMMGKFKDGADKWHFVIGQDCRDTWSDFVKIITISEKCVGFEWYLIGYQLWMSYWLKWGEDGWAAYPYPGTPPDL